METYILTQKQGYIVWYMSVPYYVASSECPTPSHIVWDRSVPYYVAWFGSFEERPLPIAWDRPVPYYVAWFQNSKRRPHSMGQMCPILCGSVSILRKEAHASWAGLSLSILVCLLVRLYACKFVNIVVVFVCEWFIIILFWICCVPSQFGIMQCMTICMCMCLCMCICMYVYMTC